MNANLVLIEPATTEAEAIENRNKLFFPIFKKRPKRLSEYGWNLERVRNNFVLQAVCS